MPFKIDGQPYNFDTGSEANREPGQEGDDFSKPLKQTLGQYLSDTTKGKRDLKQANHFPIDANYSDIHTHLPNGDPSPLAKDTNEPQYIGGSQWVSIDKATDPKASLSEPVDVNSIVRSG